MELKEKLETPLTGFGEMCYNSHRSLERGAEVRDRGHKPNEQDLPHLQVRRKASLTLRVRRFVLPNGGKRPMATNTKAESTRSYRTQITLTLTGDEYRALSDVAEAMNRVSWCGTDNTAASVFSAFVLPEFDKAELMANVVSYIATGEDGVCVPEPLHSLRLSELKAAFDAV